MDGSILIPTRETRVHRFFANSIVQGVGVFLALGLAFSGKLSQFGTILCIVLAALLACYGVWTHVGKIWLRVVLQIVCVGISLGFVKFLIRPTPNEVLQKLNELQTQINGLTLTDEPQPGFSVHLLLTLPPQPQSSTPLNIVSYGWPENNNVSIYINGQGSVLTFAIVDQDRRQYTLDAAVGSEIPLKRPFYLAASLGYGSNSSQMILSVDGKEITRRRIDHPIYTDFAKNGGFIGSNGKRPSAGMNLYGLVLYDRTLAKQDLQQLMERFRKQIRTQKIAPLDGKS